VTTRTHPSWDEIKGFLATGDPSLHVIDGDPPVSIFLDPDGPRIGLRTPYRETGFLPARPLAEIDLRIGSAGGQGQLEISTTNPSLFPYFYSFAMSVADRIQMEGEEVHSSIERSLDQWRALLRQGSMLSDEEQTGLMGELWMLKRLANVSASDALRAWTGPRGEAHDFRVGDSEFEIKTTRTERRIHHIGSLTQIVPSPNRSLYILSLQFAAAGAAEGRSLDQRLGEIRAIFEPAGLAGDFDALVLARYRIGEAERAYYRDRLQLRSPPYLVRVTEDLPCLRPEDILAIPRHEMERISDVRYRIDVNGLGFADDSPEFLALLPTVPGGDDG
jgi:hypothetical protein